MLLSVGQWVIERSPPAAERWFIGMFGRADKLALVVVMVAVALALGALVGRAGRRSFAVAGLLYPLGGAAGAWAALSQDASTATTIVVAAAGSVAAGLLTLRLLLPAPTSHLEKESTSDEPGRRRALRLVGRVIGVAAVAGGTTRLVARLAAAPSRPAVTLPTPAKPLPRPTGASFDRVPGLTPLFTRNRAFYRIDTALAVPRVDLQEWRLRVTGMVDTPFELSYAELSSMPQVEADITLSCVSNRVGGPLVGTARWQGVPLANLLARAGVQTGATQLVGRSVDGWTCGFPTQLAMDGRPALVALGMNGEPLPVTHGFPARLVVPGLFGYVSATKWIREIELTTLEAFDAYWVPRGWSKLGPVTLQSRIDVPRNTQTLAPGRRVVAGVAWGPATGIAKVEVSIDRGQWREATLARQLSTDTWRQWRYDWDATPGRHVIAVRATDGKDEVQSAERRPPQPGGATGYHTILVTVR